jgi:hypothetical protein
MTHKPICERADCNEVAVAAIMWTEHGAPEDALACTRHTYRAQNQGWPRVVILEPHLELVR